MSHCSHLQCIFFKTYFISFNYVSMNSYVHMLGLLKTETSDIQELEELVAMSHLMCAGN